MIISNDKNDCIDSITNVLESTASWRRVLVPKFNDPRNMRAAGTLEKLAVDANNLSDCQWEDLKPHFGELRPRVATRERDISNSNARVRRGTDRADSRPGYSGQPSEDER